MPLIAEPQVESDFLALINSNPDIISKISRDLTLVYVNDAVCNFSSKPRDFFIGKNIRILSGEGEKQEIFISTIQKVFKTGIPAKYQDEGWLDSSFYFEFDIIPLDKINGRVEHVLAILKNISTAKQSELDLKKNISELEILSDHLVYQNKLLQEFSYITSHNLRSPMSNLKLLLQMYQEAKDESEREFLFDKLKLLSENLSNSVNDLTGTISMKGKLVKELEDIRFEDQLEETKQTLFIDIQESKAKVTSDFEKVPSMLFPTLYLESIFLNLMTNSIKYRSPKRPLEIFVSTSYEDGFIRFEWQDNGLGIDLEKNGHHLFGLKKTFHNNKDSHGIGLYITKNQIESVGGSIAAESEVDKGCNIIIHFKIIKNTK